MKTHNSTPHMRAREGMNMIVRLAFAALWAASCFCAIAQPALPIDRVAFRDAEKKYSISYPKDWSVAPTTYERTRIKVVAPGDAADCSVNVQPIAGNMSDQAALKQIFDHAPSLEKSMQARLPGAKFLESKKTTISDQEALMILIALSRSTLGETVEIYTFTVQTVRNGSVYSVACRAPKEKFREYLPVFNQIIGSFNFWR